MIGVCVKVLMCVCDWFFVMCMMFVVFFVVFV